MSDEYGQEFLSEATEDEETVTHSAKVNQDSLLCFFFNEKFRKQTLDDLELEHRICNWERVHGKSAYCLGRTLEQIEKEIRKSNA